MLVVALDIAIIAYASTCNGTSTNKEDVKFVLWMSVVPAVNIVMAFILSFCAAIAVISNVIEYLGDRIGD